jgi:DNA repair exonuclease SbcCD nuclease subunit
MILVIGDMHFKDRLSYSDHIDRTEERNEILDFIVDQAKDCDTVVSVGDVFDRRDPPASVTRDVAAFFERFKGKQLFIISGNHDKKASGGTTALDFLREIGDKHWKIFTRPQAKVEIEGRIVDFIPHMYKGELGVTTDEDGKKEIMSHLNKADIVFHHHAVSDTLSNGVATNVFNEIVLPKKELEEIYALVVGGHIHTPGIYGRTIVTGSVFNCDMGETAKYIWKIDPKDLSVEQIELPGRGIYKLENPTRRGIEKILAKGEHNIVKVIVTDKTTDINELKRMLSDFDAYLIVEQYPNERSKVHFEDGAIDLDVLNLLDVYAKARKVDYNLLCKGYSLIQ